MVLNLGRHHPFLKAFQDHFAFRDAHPDGGGRQQILAHDGCYLFFRSFSEATFSNQFHCPFNYASLRPPTTLHALLSIRPRKCFERAEITTIDELTKWSVKNLLTVKNTGIKSAMEVHDKLQKLLPQHSNVFPSTGNPSEQLCLGSLLSFSQIAFGEPLRQKLT